MLRGLAERSQYAPRGASLSEHKLRVRPEDMPRTSYCGARNPSSSAVYADRQSSPVSRLEHEDLAERVGQLTTVWRSGSRRLELLEAVSAEQDAKIAATIEVVKKMQSLVEDGQERYDRQIGALTAELVALRSELSDLRSTVRVDISELRTGDAQCRLAALGAAVDVSNSHVHQKVREALATHGAEAQSALAAVRATLDGLTGLSDSEEARIRREQILEADVSAVRGEMSRLLERVAAVEQEADQTAASRVARVRWSAAGGGVASATHGVAGERAGEAGPRDADVGAAAPSVSPMRACFDSHLRESGYTRPGAPRPTDASGQATRSDGRCEPFVIPSALDASVAHEGMAHAPATAAAQTLLTALGAALNAGAAGRRSVGGAYPQSGPVENAGREDVRSTLQALQDQIDRLQQRTGAASEALARHHAIGISPACASGNRRGMRDSPPPATLQPRYADTQPDPAWHAPARAHAPAANAPVFSHVTALHSPPEPFSPQQRCEAELHAHVTAVCSEVLTELLRMSQVGQVGAPAGRGGC
jgi:prefoldin subunit 5